MSQDGPLWPSLPRQGKRPDKRTRERERERSGAVRNPPERSATTANHVTPAQDGTTPRPRDPRREELRVFGLNACLAAFAARPQDLRKVYLSATRMTVLREVMAYCVQNRLGYRVVEDQDLAKLTGSSHHEGVCLEMRRPQELTLATLIAQLPASEPACLLWLDGVGNPHNFGAVLRSAAHFGVAAVLLPEDSELALSGAACRVAEGGAEVVPLVRLGHRDEAIDALHASGFKLAATVPRDGESLFRASLPQRTVFVLGAEREGMQQSLIQRCDLRLTIPGTGHVESLNIASTVAVLLGAFVSRTP